MPAKATFNWDSVPLKLGVTANPAAGANPASATVPAGKVWRVLAYSASLVTSADVADRYIYLSCTDGAGHVTYRVGEAVPQTASLTVQHTFHPGAGNSGAMAAATYQTGIGTGLILMTGHTVGVVAAGIQAADDWSAAYYIYQEIPV